MKLLSANHLSFVAGGLTEATITLPEVNVEDASEEKSWKSYLPSLKNALIGAAILVVGLIGGYALKGK